jgi:hypothetical protein
MQLNAFIVDILVEIFCVLGETKAKISPNNSKGSYKKM